MNTATAPFHSVSSFQKAEAAGGARKRSVFFYVFIKLKKKSTGFLSLYHGIDHQSVVQRPDELI